MASRISKMIRDTNKFLRSGTAIKEMKIGYFVGLYSTVVHLSVAQLCFIVCKVFYLHICAVLTPDHVPYDIYSKKAAELI